jgi:hypothetical protein
MEQYSKTGKVGYYSNMGSAMTFQLGDGMPAAIDNEYDSYDLNATSGLLPPSLLNIGSSKVLIKGTNNLLPNEIELMFGSNRLLPELIDKQYRLLYGKGLFVYKQVFEDKKLFRDWQTNETIENWLGDWQSNGMPDSAETYTEKVIKDSYYFEDYWTKWRFFKGRRIGGIPVGGLEHVEDDRARLASTKDINIFDRDYTDSDFNKVIIGNWLAGSEKGMQEYPRFRMHDHMKYNTAVSYNKHHSPGKIYGINKFYYGIKDWLVATNKNPQYINSYLENSLSAKIHVIIPEQWVAWVQEQLEGFCERNRDLMEKNEPLLTPNGIDVGTEYHAGLLDAYIKSEMRSLTKFMSGTKNQGKTWTTFKYTTDKGDSVGWEIISIDMKYKEFIDSLNNYDKRADEVITSSMGIDSSISNISKDGVISKSGADVYYNYIIYLTTNLPTAERMVTADINSAIKINFPTMYKQGFRVGLYTETPSRQEEVAPQDRLQNQMNQTRQQLNAELGKTNDKLDKLINLYEHASN